MKISPTLREIKEAEKKEECGREQGHGGASEKLYSYGQMQEEMELAAENAREETKTQAFIDGWKACQAGQPLSQHVSFDDSGLPSFLN